MNQIAARARSDATTEIIDSLQAAACGVDLCRDTRLAERIGKVVDNIIEAAVQETLERIRDQQTRTTMGRAGLLPT